MAGANARANVVVTMRADERDRELVTEMLEPLAEIVFLHDLTGPARAEALLRANALLCLIPTRELRGEDYDRLGRVRLLQMVSAGADHIPFERLPADMTIASNVGAYGEPMAEHVLAMTLALLKRLPQEHAKMRQGIFDQQTPTRSLRGAVVGIIGFGGIGRAVGRIMRPFGVRIHGITRSGRSSEPAEFVGGVEALDEVLQAADVVVLALPLSRRTEGLIGARELALMKSDAVLVNVARGAIIDEKALYEHLLRYPDFGAGIDTWWAEPYRTGTFRMNYPFLDLPNVIGSPHNSALVPGSLRTALRQAAENVAAWLRREPIAGVVPREDYVETA